MTYIDNLELRLRAAKEELALWRKKGREFDLYRVEVCNLCGKYVRDKDGQRECLCRKLNYSRIEIHCIKRRDWGISMGEGINGY